MKLKSILTYLLTVLLAVACSEVEDLAPVLGGDELTVSFAVPAIESVGTRGEDDLTSITTLVLGADNALLKAEKTPMAGAKTLTVKLPAGSKESKVIFIANSPKEESDFAGVNSLSGLRAMTLDDCKNDGSYVMSGSGTVESLRSSGSVALYRHCSEVTVSKKDDETTTYPFEVWGASTSASLICAADKDKPELGTPDGTSRAGSTATEQSRVCVHPTKNKSGKNLMQTFVIVKAKFEGSDYYYRLDFQTQDDGVLDLLPNHRYEFVINGDPENAGYETADEAALNPTPLSNQWYTIHDKSPEVYNIISDGTRELGVSHEVTYTGDEDGTATFHVKLFSTVEGDDDFKTNYGKYLSLDSDWLEVTGVSDKSDTSDLSDQSDPSDVLDNPGRVYEVTVKFMHTLEPGTLTGNINVVWKGLKRTVPVTWNRDFDPTKLIKSCVLTVKEGSTAKYTQENYFSYIRNTVKGMDAAANNGVARNDGLHFPMKYGDDKDNPWTYNYELALNDLGAGVKYEWKHETRGIDGVTVSSKSAKTLQGEGPVLTLSGGGGLDYKRGELKISVRTEGSDDWQTYSIKLYHTGFIHEGLYYEVVLMGGTHWLDRNLGATSAGMYIENVDGTPYYGDEKAKGEMLRVATYVQHGTPKMDATKCPPGYDYPTSAQWDAVRNANPFVTDARGGHYTAEYRVSAEKVVYFPKAGYLDAEGRYEGEAHAGYYWTQTAAGGLEKDQIGAWLKAFTILGTATGYMNANVDTDLASVSVSFTKSKGYAMPVRCVAKDEYQAKDPQRTWFWVKGATHVYLYMVGTDGSHNAVTAWPGIPVGNSQTADIDFNFAYESSTFVPDKLYVIFNYKGPDGIVSAYRGTDGEAEFSRTAAPLTMDGWKVIGDTGPGGVTTALGLHWAWTHTDDETLTLSTGG